MDIAFLSDIHGNWHALETCLDHALQRGIKNFVFLGDYIGELAYPQRTMRLLYELKKEQNCHFLRGNKEDYWLGCRKSGKCAWKDGDSTTGALLYAYRNLTEEDLDFFAGLKSSDILFFKEEKPITVCHGSPRRTNEKMLEDERTFKIMEECGTELILCGHTHRQGVIEHGGKRVLNPGSVGGP